ncbi:MAG: hypothetical protein AVDCRST_MAG74-344 [uncultured Pyrinomonadaceae bacterium]|uniref:Peptidase M28 domain-containing protein n=1 Tax=uncultured Pyrinomonadaceae bacterium TaxID=2283094 RepID=A0A6J4N850_9BACT|nr:MAG: hypothetical protein AVDCRST_MAG74-344 [uncultured Pyrinomonadaceae bacterium]
MNLTRRQFFSLTTGAGVALACRGFSNAQTGAAAVADLETIKTRCARIIREYDRQGIHRTATDVDSRSAKWLAKLVRENGAQPRLESFVINRIDLMENYLHIGDRRIEGVPMFDGGFTDPKGIRGRLGKIGSDAEIGLIEAPPNAATDFNDVFIQARRNSKHKAIVILTLGGADGIAIINAPYFLEPFAQPALQVGREHREFLQKAAEKNAEIEIIAEVKRKSVTAFNVTAEITGTDKSLRPVGVITPRSGWWEIASERGGGLCAWLETMRAIAKTKPRRTFYFAASSGHELGHVGLENYLELRKDLAKDAHVWLHFGANIGSRFGASRNLRASSEELEKLAARALTENGVAPDRLLPRNVMPNGEAKNLYKRGGKFISLIGGNALFHLPQDRFPDAVDLDVIARVCAAFSRLAVDL